jgi:hypothetical protein
MADKNDASKMPQPQNSGPRERPAMPENRVIKGNDPRPHPIKAVKP